MVINITLGFPTFDCATPGRVPPGAACGFFFPGWFGVVCPKPVHPATKNMTTVSAIADESVGKRVDKTVQKRGTICLFRRRQLLRTPHLLVCLRLKSLVGQRLG